MKLMGKEANRMSKNAFEIDGDIISITRPEWGFKAYATVREDYLDEIQSVTWGLSYDRYPYNSKLGTLHSYIMKKWYGEEFCQEMKEKDYVIDHMDNDSHNCCINNLSFLSNAYNKAKGLTFDQENKAKEFIALTMFKDFFTGLYQITIMFNYPATLVVDGFDTPSVIELAYLLYEGDYRKVIADAEDILRDYKEDYTFNPEKTRAIDYHIEGCVGKTLPLEVHEEYLSGKHGHTVCYFTRRAAIQNWTKDTKETYFVISDVKRGIKYQIKLFMGSDQIKTIRRDMNTTLLIMAAGIGSRFGTGIKQLEPVDVSNHIIMDYSIHDAIEAGFNHVVFIIRRDIEKEFKEVIGDRIAAICASHNVTVDYAFQDIQDIPGSLPEGRTKPWRTGQAVLAAKSVIDTPFIVINADDYYGVDGYKVMADFLTSHEEKDGKAPFAMVGYHLGNTVTENGYVSRGVCEVDDNHQLLSITERTHIEKREDHAEFTKDDGATWASLPFDTLVSMNFFGFQPMIMDELEKGFPTFLDQAIKENPLKGEYFIPSVASDLLHDGKASLEVLVSKDQWYGVTYPEDKQSVIEALAALRENGTYQF